MRLGHQLAVLVAALPLTTATALASSSCYVQDSYPAVLHIETTQDGFRTYTVSTDYEKALGKAIELQKQNGWGPSDPGVAYTYPVIDYSEQNGFSLGSPVTCHTNRQCEATALRAPSCVADLPPRERLIEDALRTEPSFAKKPLDHTISITPRDNDIDQDYGACML
ncbi:MAG: hypothetical protein ACRERU_04245, partial [Methylococcales bacterium]